MLLLFFPPPLFGDAHGAEFLGRSLNGGGGECFHVGAANEEFRACLRKHFLFLFFQNNFYSQILKFKKYVRYDFLFSVFQKKKSFFYITKITEF